MPFTKENKPLLEEAATLNFQFMKNGKINYHKHGPYERGLFFIKQAIEKHGNKYGYDKVIYVNNNTKVIIKCKEHGEFKQIPSDHINGHACIYCGGTGSPTTQEFVQKARIVHGDRYNYNKVMYRNNRDNVEIICPEHNSFFQSPANHLNGSGCPRCVGRHKPTTNEWIEKARAIHGDKYDYSKVIYKTSIDKVEILCPQHGAFFQIANNHLRFHGCPRCAGHNHNILYLLKCQETGWYKIGVTTDTVQNRISSIGGKLEEVHHVILDDPRKHESILHKKYEREREYNLCVRDGKTEFFSLTEEQVHEVIDYMNEVSDEG